MNKVVFISGVTGTLGSALARHFARAGFCVCGVFEKNKNFAKQLEAEMEKISVRCLFECCSVCDVAVLGVFFKKVQSVLGCVDVMVNAAGIARDSVIAKMSPDDWQQVVDVNLGGVFNCVQAGLPFMALPGVGHIINIGSFVGCAGAAGQANYAASKAGLCGLTKQLAKQLGKENIKVNLVLPGIMESNMTRGLDLKFDQHCLGRPSTLEEICGFIVFLTGTQNISGQVFNLDSRVIGSI